MNKLFEQCPALFVAANSAELIIENYKYVYGKTYVEDNLYIDENEKLWIRENYDFKQVSEDDEPIYRMIYGEIIDKVVDEEKRLKSLYKQFGIKEE